MTTHARQNKVDKMKLEYRMGRERERERERHGLKIDELSLSLLFGSKSTL